MTQTVISVQSLVVEADRDYYEKSRRPWVYKFGKPSNATDSAGCGRYVVQGEAAPSQPK
jgi:hypothetical protein